MGRGEGEQIENRSMMMMRMVASLSARAYSGGGAGGPDEPDEPDDGPQCFYKVLGVDETATEAEVKKAYRNLALKHQTGPTPHNHALTFRALDGHEKTKRCFC